MITQPAQGPPLALAQISGLAGVPTQKAQVTAHAVQQQHSASVQHRGNELRTLLRYFFIYIFVIYMPLAALKIGWACKFGFYVVPAYYISYCFVMGEWDGSCIIYRYLTFHYPFPSVECV